MLQFHANAAQAAVIEGISFWGSLYAREKEAGTISAADLEKMLDNLRAWAPEADRLAIPFWVQNAAAVRSENWRDVLGRGIWSILEARGIYREEATA